MDEHGTAAAGDAGPRIVIELDDQVVEVVLAPQPVPGRGGRHPNGAVVVAVGRVFAPCVVRRDGPHRQPRWRARAAVGTKPNALEAEAAARRAAVTFALVGQNAAAPERHRQGQRPGLAPAAATISRRRTRVQPPDCRTVYTGFIDSPHAPSRSKP